MFRTLALSTAFTLIVIAPPVHATTVLVTPSNLGDWTLHSTNNTGIVGTGTATAEIIVAPPVPPLGVGAAHLMTDTGAGNGSAQMRNSAFHGTRLDALTSFSYSTYVTSWNGSQVPYLTIWLDTDNNGIRDDRLWFEPTYSRAAAANGNPNPQADPVLNTWQTWDVLEGMVYSDTVAGPGSNAITFSAYLLAKPDATIVSDTAQNLGGIRVASGFASAAINFDAYVDAFTIGTALGTTTYNFEASAPIPEPATLVLAGLALLGLVGIARRRK